MPVQPYLFFNGRCEEALAFYREALGAEITSMLRFNENPEPPSPGCVPVAGEKIMHASFRVGDGEIMASDGMTSEEPEFRGFSLVVTAADPAEAQKRFGALSSGGEVRMPLGKTFFSPCFGVVADRYGVSWMVIVQPS